MRTIALAHAHKAGLRLGIVLQLLERLLDRSGLDHKLLFGIAARCCLRNSAIDL